jgi:dimethylargininase
MFAAMIALTREVPTSFANAVCAAAPDEAIDVERARRQHAAYRDALASCGVDVITLPAADVLPDSCFVEDTAVLAGGLALITRPGAPSRRAEPLAIAQALAGHCELAHVEDPATLDGGDCMRVGSTLYVGRSARTNALGVTQLAEAFQPRGIRVVPVDLPAGILHLKCICAPLGPDRITLAEGTIPRDVFDADIVSVPAAEAYAANVVAIGDRVIMADGFPRTADALARAGLRVIRIATTEFRKADGSLTCLSILV